MKLSITELFLIGLAITLCFLLYEKNSDLDYSKETIFIQGEAISKQQALINHQSRYIHLLEANEQRHYSPVRKFPL
mgnify:CR=1 FL=1